MGLVLVLILLVPCFGSALAWLLLKKLPRPFRLIGSVTVGIAPAAMFAFGIYQNESGGGDPDPLTFLQIAVAVSAVMAVATTIGLEVVEARR